MIDLAKYIENALACSALGSNYDVDSYLCKLLNNAEIISLISKSRVKGFIAYYSNREEKDYGFITYVHVDSNSRDMGVAKQLIKACILDLKRAGFHECRLEVDTSNIPAYRCYKSLGFSEVSKCSTYHSKILMKIEIGI